MKPKTINLIIKAVNRAEEKHTSFADGDYQVVSLAAEELGEFAQAINDDDTLKARSEALDLIAVLVRYLEGDE